MNPTAQAIPVPESAIPRVEGPITPRPAKWEIPPTCIPDYDKIITDDGAPVDNIFVEKQQRLLVEPLYSSWTPAGDNPSFLAVSNVGLFFGMNDPPIVPDAMLSMGVRAGPDLHAKEHRSYFVWVIGKLPEVVVEIVSDLRGGEETDKMRAYARLHIPYYIIFDPFEKMKHGILRVYRLEGLTYRLQSNGWLPEPSIGVTLWSGEFEDLSEQWLRWCDEQGQVIPTGREARVLADRKMESAEQKAEHAERKAESAERKAESAERKAESAERKAESAERTIERLQSQLKALGIEPEKPGP